METLIQLPNRDLWKGFDPARPPRNSMENVAPVVATPEEAQAKAGNECLWCGMKMENEAAMKEHVEKLHFQATHSKEVVREFLTGTQSK